MTILFTLVNLFMLAFMARWEWRRSGFADNRVYWMGLCVRLLGGLMIGILYKCYYNYTGDTFTFFNDAVSLTESSYSAPAEYLKFFFTGVSPVHLVTEEPRSLFFVGILSAVNLVTHNNYWLSSLWFSFFAFWCSWRLVIRLDTVFPTARMASRIALLFIPSVVFWSSGIIKESLAFGSIAILVSYFLSFLRGDKLKWNAYIEIIIFLYLLLSLKYYWGAVLIPSMISSFIVYWTIGKTWNNVWAVAGVWLLVFSLLLAIASLTHPNFYLSRFLSVILENHNNYLAISRDGNVIHYNDLSENWKSIVGNSPWALWSGLFRPMIFEAQTITGIFGAIENLIILVLFIWKLKFIRLPLPENRLIVMAAIVYVMVLCVFLALSTPNLGTLSRYRVGFLSFFVMMILADHPLLGMIYGRTQLK